MLLTRPLRLIGRRSHFASRFSRSAPVWGKVLQKFKLADIGEGITECEVIRWSVKLNSTISSFDPLCEVQSDKASVEITSPFDGIVKELLVKEGEVCKVGEGLCLIEVDEEVAKETPDLESIDAGEKSASTSPPPAAAKIEGDQIQEAVEKNSFAPERRLHPMDPNYTPPPPLSSKPPSQPQTARTSSSTSDVLAAPSVRHLARQLAVDLSQVAPGSGKGGRVEKRDVEAFASGSSSKDLTSSSSATSEEKDIIVELGRTRFGMWKAMVKSLDIPHFGYSTTLDLTDLHRLLPLLNTYIPHQYLPSSSPPPPLPVNPSALYPSPLTSIEKVPEGGRYEKLTYLPVLLKMLGKAMIEWPLLRSSITPESTVNGGRPTLTIRPSADITLALSTPTGLYTPLLPSINTSSIYALNSRIRYLAYLGRQEPCGLTPKEMPKRGGTLTVSNVGAIGEGDFASPVLVPGGGVAIVAIGRAKWVWDVNRNPSGERRLKVGVSWSADHRVVEGAELAAFVECWRSWVESPGRLIGDGV